MVTARTNPHLSVPQLDLLSLEIIVRWRRPTIIPGPVVTNVLRGALGLIFRKLVCPTEWMDHPCHPCPMYLSCPYGQLFMPTPPPEASKLRLQQDLPKPYVIEPPGLQPDRPVTTERLPFALILIGNAIDRLPYFITTLECLGHEGLGRDRVPFDIETITSLHPDGNELLFMRGEPTVRLPSRRITTCDVLRSPSHLTAPLTIPQVDGHRALSESASRTLKLHFLTPMLLKTGSGVDTHGRRIKAYEIRERPPFGVLARRLRDRLSALCSFFGKPWQDADFAGLGQAADAVQLVDSHTVWLTRVRRSTRTGDSHEISGFVGQAVYEFPNHDLLATFWPLLKLGEYVHVGKNAPWGHGKILVERYAV